MGYRRLGLLGLFGGFALSGCLGNLMGNGGEPVLAGKTGSITISHLDRLLESFADREVALLATAADAIARDCCKTTAERSLARRMKSMNAMAVYDIVTTPNPLTHLVDLYVLINLQHLVWIEEDQALRIFGEKGKEHASAALGRAKEEMSRLADQAMKDEHRAALDQKIRQWRRENPQVRFVAMIRFENLTEVAGQSALETIGSFFDILNPLDDAAQQVEDARMMAERVFFFGKRFPQLMSWQSETALDELLAGPEVSRLLEGAGQTAASIDRVSKAIETVPAAVAAERQEMLAAWDAREAKLDSSVREIRGTFAEGKEFAAAATELSKSVALVLREVEKLGEPSRNPAPGPPGKPFDIAEYSAAAAEMSKLARELRTTLEAGQSLVDSPAWQKRQEDLHRASDDAAENAERHGNAWVDHLSIRAAEILFLFFALLLLTRWMTRRLQKPTPRVP